MFYNNTKNLSALALILAMSFSLANMSYAQGVITLVDEEADELGLSDDADATADILGVQEESATDEVGIENVPEDETTPDTATETNVNTPAVDSNPAENDEEILPDEETITPAEALQPQLDTLEDDVQKEFDDINALEDTLQSLNSEEKSPLLAPESAPESGKPLLEQRAEKEAEVKNLTSLGDSVLSQIDNELFMQMSDIEKQTTLLSLELRREKLKSEIAAIKSQRQQAEEKEEEERLEREQRKKDLQTEKEIEKVKELQILEDKKAAYEVLRQEKSLNDYKNKMLENEQKWINENQRMYEKIQKMEDERKEIIADFEHKLNVLKEESARLVESAQTAKNDYETTVSSLSTQNTQLRKRLEVETSVGTNPFSTTGSSGGAEITPDQLNLDYVIMEIRGKGDDLIAKLVNENGESFLVKKGSILKTGHVVKKITHNYIALENNGIEDYLQFAAGGVVTQEPVTSNVGNNAKQNKKAEEKEVDRRPSLMMDSSIPSLGTGMFVK